MIGGTAVMGNACSAFLTNASPRCDRFHLRLGRNAFGESGVRVSSLRSRFYGGCGGGYLSTGAPTPITVTFALALRPSGGGSHLNSTLFAPFTSSGASPSGLSSLIWSPAGL